MLVDGIFCDLEKAFDCVCHEVLLNKLRFYGIKYKQYNLYNHIYRIDFRELLFAMD
jgi:hypothetical protein